MPKKPTAPKKKLTDTTAPPLPAVPQIITDTIRDNYMPYVMTVIVSRAIPEIDGFKPSQRKLLYTMYKMGLLTGPRTKSTNIVGQTMKLNPHGDASIYETMVRLTRGNGALLHPFIDSKGCFGKQYSRDMAFAAARYTEAKLDPFCNELFSGIDRNAVDLVPNYDNTMLEPVLLPTTFPNVLVSPNSGIAVGMASNVCSFNLAEVCDATIALLKKPNTTTDKLLELMPAPDFSGGAEIIYDKNEMKAVFETGRGSVRMRSVWQYNKKDNCIEILEIPYSTTIEAIMKKLTELYKAGKLKEVSDFRDEIDLNGFKLTLDLKRGTDPDRLMQRLFRSTPLASAFDCNFNILIDGAPRTMGVGDILREWIRFRIGCFVRECRFDLEKKEAKLHLLVGLGKILLDIDRAIAIVRGTEKEADVVPNLCREFAIDEIQAEYIAEIKLRHLNREYILDRVREIEDLQKEIARLNELLSDELKQRSAIAEQLSAIKKKYGKPRVTRLVGAETVETEPEVVPEENYPVRVVLTREGYFKKITMKSLQGNDIHYFKEGDEIIFSADCENISKIIFLTNMRQMYFASVSDFSQVKASSIGEFVNAKLRMDQGEKPICAMLSSSVKPTQNLVFLFENGKGVRVPLSAYETKATRRRLTGAYSAASSIVAAFYEDKPLELLLESGDGRAILLSSKLIPEKTTRTASGVQVITLKKGQTLVSVSSLKGGGSVGIAGLRKMKIPASGILLSAADRNKLFSE
ncbi:MAG: DNA gyrase subunit A [Eubacteriales bacterium]|nr:DNA gyrase subunit A [Eubacteriales bacterium]